MTHPFAGHRQSSVERKRVGKITKGYAGGGHADAAEDRAMVKSMVKGKALKIDGKASGGRLDRYARGGKVKGKKGGTNVNVIIAPQGGGGAPGAMLKPPMLPPPPMGGPPPGMGAGPPGMPPMPPGAPPPGMPGMHRSGGRAYAAGGKVKNGPAFDEGKRNGTQVQHSDGKSDGKDLGRGKPVTYASGGRTEAPGLLGKKVNMATMGFKRPPGMGKAASPTSSMPKMKMGKVKFATGGAVEAGTSMGPKMRAGDNGEGRLAKAAMQKRAK